MKLKTEQRKYKTVVTENTLVGQTARLLIEERYRASNTPWASPGSTDTNYAAVTLLFNDGTYIATTAIAGGQTDVFYHAEARALGKAIVVAIEENKKGFESLLKKSAHMSYDEYKNYFQQWIPGLATLEKIIIFSDRSPCDKQPNCQDFFDKLSITLGSVDFKIFYDIKYVSGSNAVELNTDLGEAKSVVKMRAEEFDVKFKEFSGNQVQIESEINEKFSLSDKTLGGNKILSLEQKKINEKKLNLIEQTKRDDALKTTVSADMPKQIESHTDTNEVNLNTAGKAEGDLPKIEEVKNLPASSQKLEDGKERDQLIPSHAPSTPQTPKSHTNSTSDQLDQGKKKKHSESQKSPDKLSSTKFSSPRKQQKNSTTIQESSTSQKLENEKGEDQHIVSQTSSTPQAPKNYPDLTSDQSHESKSEIEGEWTTPTKTSPSRTQKKSVSINAISPNRYAVLVDEQKQLPITHYFTMKTESESQAQKQKAKEEEEKKEQAQEKEKDQNSSHIKPGHSESDTNE